jgi:hypothetical protein
MLKRITLGNKEVFTFGGGGYLVVAFDKYLNVREWVPVDSLKEARKFMKIFFEKFGAESVDIAKIREKWHVRQ